MNHKLDLAEIDAAMDSIVGAPGSGVNAEAVGRIRDLVAGPRNMLESDRISRFAIHGAKTLMSQVATFDRNDESAPEKVVGLLTTYILGDVYLGYRIGLEVAKARLLKGLPLEEPR